MFGKQVISLNGKVSTMPDVEPLRFPSREGRTSQQGDLQAIYSGRHRTCALLNPSPCVNKAVHHIHELRIKVKYWSRVCQQSRKFKPDIDQDTHRYNETYRLQSRDSDTDSVTSAELYIEGIAIGRRGPLSPLLKKINDVLGEVLYLIERLEADQHVADEALRKERRRKNILENKIGRLLSWKQQEHACAVQKERDICLRDINELKWHLILGREKLDQDQEKLSHTEILNQRLQEDIGFVKKQASAVKEKLDFQSGIISQIKRAQEESDEAWTKAQSDLILAEKELKWVELEVKSEKASLEYRLIDMKNQLTNRLEELEQLKTLGEEFSVEIKVAEQSDALTANQCATITQCISEMMELEKTEKERVLQLKTKIEDETQTVKKLKDKFDALQKHTEKITFNGEMEISEMKELLNCKHNTLAALHQENMEYELKEEDCKIKISSSEKVVKQMHEERKQMLQKICDNDEQWERAVEELTQVLVQHSAVEAKLEKLEQLTFMEKQKARVKIDKLQNELTGQTTALKQLKDQCDTVTQEMHQHQRNSALMNQKLQKEFEDASLTTKALETKVEKIKILAEKLDAIQWEHKNSLASLQKQRNLKFNHLKTVKDEHAAIIQRHDNTLKRISDLTKNCTEFRTASDEMEETTTTLPKVIMELQSLFDVVDLRHQSAALIMSTLQSNINNCLQRTQRSMQSHTAHVRARKKKMEGTQLALEISLKKNTQLASEYEGLQMIHMKAKREAVSVLNEKNHAQKSSHYYTQLSLLQKRMHKGLVKYFKQRRLYSQAELDRCQALSQETDQKIKTAQNGIADEIQRISGFLESLTDDSTTTVDASVNKQAGPDAAGWNY
ncbi:coiled-coil domain-containing protein 178 [Thalassophryne amazonica]|uniref:coiled-coil domain-containing protein 178 n=1 Tax=Thalassophryne amazonica TaxID=390379 RepID=UPI001471A8E7|nr:coiled-coil domain-containing protein 178 [Thalassophryne amazonica]